MNKQSKRRVERGDRRINSPWAGGKVLVTSSGEGIARLLGRRVGRKPLQIREGMTFKEFRAALRALGFERIHTTGNHKVYVEPKSDTVVAVPIYKDSDEVSLLHIRAVRRLLSEKGLVK